MSIPAGAKFSLPGHTFHVPLSIPSRVILLVLINTEEGIRLLRNVGNHLQACNYFHLREDSNLYQNLYGNFRTCMGKLQGGANETRNILLTTQCEENVR